MKIYVYNKDTLEYLGESVADKDPLDESNWLISANATALVPPPPKEGFTVNFENNSWVHKEIPPEPEPESGFKWLVTPTYYEYRQLEYPPITEYLDGIVKGDQAQIDKYIADCQAVKAKFPKGA